jgi:hypothetical protein
VAGHRPALARRGGEAAGPTAGLAAAPDRGGDLVRGSGRVRPADEYRPPTDAEWTEFEEHFDKRKVELGTCGRPYGTPCQHEFACIKCPVLQVDPKMLARLDEIEADLLARRERAQAEGWRDEIEGLDLTLSFLRNKRAHTQRFTRRVQLGLPAVHQPSARKGTP